MSYHNISGGSIMDHVSVQKNCQRAKTKRKKERMHLVQTHVNNIMPSAAAMMVTHTHTHTQEDVDDSGMVVVGQTTILL
jgi:hypothetical protein